MYSSPKVTIGIPAFNASRFLSFAIRSILKQTFQDWELIITDDGSTDNTVKIAQRFNDPRIRIIFDGQNRGISFRLNQQLAMAQGKYFARMDADDIMFPDRLATQVEYMEAHPEIDITSGGAIIIDDDNKIIGQRINPAVMHFSLEHWIGGATLMHPTVMAKTSFLQFLKYDSAFDGVEDRQLWFRACQCGKIDILPRPLIFYRDPLVFKLKTYLSRCNQNQKLFFSPDVKEKLDTTKLIKAVLGTTIRKTAATILSTIGQSQLMINRRNTPCENKAFFISVLNASIH